MDKLTVTRTSRLRNKLELITKFFIDGYLPLYGMVSIRNTALENGRNCKLIGVRNLLVVLYIGSWTVNLCTEIDNYGGRKKYIEFHL